MRLLATMVLNAEGSYKSALEELNSSIHAEKILHSIDPNVLRLARVERIRVGLSALGISDGDLERFHIIHVTGSKGKGTTCATIEAILRNSGYKTGFLSSPHLVNVEERIRINGRPIDKNYFGKLFWHVHNCLQMTTQDGPMCSYLQYITLIACTAFYLEKVDAVIMEVGIGGRYDHTNFFSKPAVSVVTGIQLEHTEILGNTTEQIARNKAGIFKRGCPAVIPAELSESLLQVFQEEANFVECPLYQAPRLEDLVLANPPVHDLLCKMNPQLPGPWSLRSRSLGIGLAATQLWVRQLNGTQLKGIGLQPLDISITETDLKAALASKWPGRWQIVSQDKVTYFIDGAHTTESIEHTAAWFMSKTSCDLSISPFRILLFTVIGNRDPEPMLQCLQDTVKPPFDLVVFSSPYCKNSTIPPSKQSRDEDCLTTWKKLQRNTDDHPCVRIQTVTQLIDWFDQSNLSNEFQSPLQCYSHLIADRDCHVLVTGSLYLVGAVLGALREPI